MGTPRRSALVALSGAAILLTAASSLQAGSLYQNRYNQAPHGGEMLADVLLVRPVSLVATGVGAVGWVLSLPFSALGGNVGEAGEVLVKEPFAYTFSRPVGYMEQDAPSRYLRTEPVR